MYTSEKRDEILNSFDEGVSEIFENGHPVLDTNPVDLLEDLDAINDYIKDNLNHAVFSKIPEGSLHRITSSGYRFRSSQSRVMQSSL